MSGFGRTTTAVLIGMVAACSSGKTPADSPSPRPGIIEPAPSQPGAGSEPQGIQQPGSTSKQPDPTSRPTGDRADGAPCSAGHECTSGVCEGEGCEPDAGRCVPAQRMCTRDLVEYCGCSGVTFRASGSCAGERFEHRGPCKDDPKSARATAPERVVRFSGLP